ncbi:MAG: hypothetical protein OQJ96_02915 [Flavobacteriales bacterium]|nr:hypothetical protein [Flavobacteriales bacterium]MCW8913132.1 hypothetical protein [Flavobacteriales bacterium]MCW8937787.1 hypothetical protein [Flavobacteriales bacterium]MCW8940037.1 hypothetical protein [Flavobacteriales bacterium]MCW8967401.1 hypothetical protein [Flavobacteriales bacterium]
MKTQTIHILTKKIKRITLLFIFLLVLSGITAFPLQTEINFLADYFNTATSSSLIFQWMNQVNIALNNVNQNYPFLAYGTDWLAFSHIIISLFFIGVYINPVQNSWVTKVGIIACLLVFPVAFIAGNYRGIPLFWQLIDCCFGAFGLIPLLLIHKYTNQIISISNISNYKIA